MLKIKNENVKMNGHWFDYELEDGTLLHNQEWNGEQYTVKNEDGSETEYRPIYFKYVFDDVVYEIVGFTC